MAGYFKLGANIDIPEINVFVSGKLQAYFNTFETEETIDVPQLLENVVGFEEVVIFARRPKFDSHPTEVNSMLLVEDDKAPQGAYFTLGAEGRMDLFDTLALEGQFLFSLSSHIDI